MQFFIALSAPTGHLSQRERQGGAVIAPAIPHRFNCHCQRKSGGSKRPPYEGAPINWNLLIASADVCHPEGTNVTEGSQRLGRTYSDAADCCSILEILRLRLRDPQDDKHWSCKLALPSSFCEEIGNFLKEKPPQFVKEGGIGGNHGRFPPKSRRR